MPTASATSEPPRLMAIRLKSQQCLARQVCAASPNTRSTAGCGPAVCGQAAACLPGASAVPLGRSGETSWLGSNEGKGARACAQHCDQLLRVLSRRIKIEVKQQWVIPPYFPAS